MPGQNEVARLQQRLLGNITLLKILTETPEIPKENSSPQHSDAQRCLSFRREQALAESLAFLAARTDNVDRVMAVCVEEDADQMGLTIRIAANSGDLADVEAGFKTMAGILAHAALGGQSLFPVLKVLSGVYYPQPIRGLRMKEFSWRRLFNSTLREYCPDYDHDMPEKVPRPAASLPYSCYCTARLTTAL